MSKLLDITTLYCTLIIGAVISLYSKLIGISAMCTFCVQSQTEMVTENYNYIVNCNFMC